MLLAVIVGAVGALGTFVLTEVCVSAMDRTPPRPSDCIIVLGARVWPDGRLSNSLEYRCESALEAWQNGVAPEIIVCGGKGANEPEIEAVAMKRWLTARGVPEALIHTDETSANTVENLENARAIMQANGFATAAVCTSDYHLRRALWIARDAGIAATGIAAKSPKKLDTLISNRLRESCSWVLYWLRKTGWIH